jgi:hypothetical protein
MIPFTFCYRFFCSHSFPATGSNAFNCHFFLIYRNTYHTIITFLPLVKTKVSEGIIVSGTSTKGINLATNYFFKARKTSSPSVAGLLVPRMKAALKADFALAAFQSHRILIILIGVFFKIYPEIFFIDIQQNATRTRFRFFVNKLSVGS